jgi:hypothetical protein
MTVSTDPVLSSLERYGEPVSIGVAVPRGAVHRDDHWSLTDHRGRAVPVQTTTLDRWGDGSVRWLLADFQCDVLPDTPSYYALAPDTVAVAAPSAVQIEQAGEVLRVHTAAAAFDVARSGPDFIAAVHVDGAAVLHGASITAEDAAGNRYQFVTRRLVIERSGELRAAVRLDGGLVDRRGRDWLEGRVRLGFFAGLSTVAVDVEVTNPRAARHPGGTWDLGDPGSVYIRDLSIVIRTGNGDLWGSVDHSDQMQPAGDRFAVYQASSGGTHWQHGNHVNRDNRVPFTFRGFRATRAGRLIEGLRASPIASIGSRSSRVSVVVPRFWQLCPKAIEAEPGFCRIGMFPGVHDDLHELQGGERSTLSFGICFGRDTVSAEPLAWMRAPVTVSADPASYRQAGVWAPLPDGSRAAAKDFETLVNVAIEGNDTFEHRREQIDEYGWRNFGDLYADHEAVHQPLVAHYNNQYDAIAGFLTRFAETADQRWWSLANDLARHVTDIDLYHTTRDRAAYNGGLFWHTQHYQSAGTATHRAYSRRTGSSGGGPSAEHNYTSGLMLHYFMTGSERSREAVIQLADWVIEMDDGRKSRFRWFDRASTGYASSTRSLDFQGPGRGAGNSINALLDAHRLTHDPRYLEKAAALVSRCVHPNDDPAALQLLDVENRWSYTVFLQVLGKYVEYHAELGLIGSAYEYARNVLVRYADWMEQHERPYLDAPEQLEFPTETWAAQDLRKAAVFEFAARFTAEPEQRERFVARAGQFVEGSIAYLLASPTARLTRPIVLLLAYRLQRPQADAPAIEAGEDRAWPAKTAFVPQRLRVERRLTWFGASAAALLVIALFASL